MRTWRVGFNDRGHGHGDYGVIDESGKLIAEIKTGLFEDASLMASSPELLAFAESFVGDDCMCEPDVTEDDKCALCRAMVIISKIGV